jgi:FolB domain-containing protein
MADSLRLDIDLQTRIGVTEKERKSMQKVQVSLSMETDAAAVAKNDDLTQGINYAMLVDDLHALAASERNTIERLAEDIAAMVLEKYRTKRVEVIVRKYPPLKGLREASVRIERLKK